MNRTNEVIEGFSWRKGDCIIDLSNISQGKNSKCYYPFQEIASSSDNPFYRDFAYLDYNNYQELLDFANSYGLLGLRNHPRFKREKEGESFYINLRRNKKREVIDQALYLKGSIDTIDFILKSWDSQWGIPSTNLITLKEALKTNIPSIDAGLQKQWTVPELWEDLTSSNSLNDMIQQLFQESISDWKREIIRMRWFIETISGINKKDYVLLRTKLKEGMVFSEMPNLANNTESVDNWSDFDVYNLIKITFLPTELNKEIEGIKPYYICKPNKPPFKNTIDEIEYHCPSLLSMMYFSILSDYTKEEVTFDICDYCGHSFIKINPNKDYCIKCQKRAKQKRYRFRDSILKPLKEKLNSEQLNFCEKELLEIKDKTTKEAFINELKEKLIKEFPNGDFSYFGDLFIDR